MRGLAAEFAGELGVYAKHLGTGDVIALNADTRFPTASVIKVAIMVAAGRRAAISAGPRDFPEHALALKHSSTRLASARRGTPTGHA